VEQVRGVRVALDDEDLRGALQRLRVHADEPRLEPRGYEVEPVRRLLGGVAARGAALRREDARLDRRGVGRAIERRRVRCAVVRVILRGAGEKADDSEDGEQAPG